MILSSMPLILGALIKKGIISQPMADKFQKESEVLGKNIEDILLERGVVNEAVLLKVKSETLGLPVKELAKEEKIPSDILNLIPEDSARNYKIAAIGKKGKDLLVVALYPEDPDVQNVLRFLSQKLKLNIVLYLVKRSDLRKIWQGYEMFSSEIEEALAVLRRKRISFKPPIRFINLEEVIGTIGEEAPIIKIVSILLRHGVSSKASDIHIEPLKEKLRIRYRLDGVLYPSLYLPLEILPPIVSRIKVLAGLKIDETRKPQDGRFSTVVSNKEIDYRVSTFPTAVGEKVAIRILDPEVGLRRLSDLGLVGHSNNIVKEALKKPFGMILITGPTGSGKTTTLYALLQELDREKVNIVTLEDPVEYFIEGINQSQIRPDIGYDFASGLRQILRQDPDVIMVGEIRDKETAALAVNAALTGHLVFSTLHTNNALGVIPRLTDMGVPPYLLPSALSVMIAQRLVPKLCPYCKKEVKASTEMEKLIKEALASLPDSEKKRVSQVSPPYTIYEPQGCPKCNYKGVKGRIALFEAIAMTPELGRAIGKGIDEEIITEEAKRQNMVSMHQDGILKALEGIVSLESVMKETE